ncbi:MAG: hypothetical protein ABSA21_04055 [Candidatus Limnocylindrales bacterium]|jgi:hypothetical protein
MVRVLGRQARGLLVLLTVVAIALAACSSSSSGTNGTAAPATGGNVGTAAPATGNSGGGSGLSGAAAQLAAIDSYKFTMTLAGGDWGSMLSALGGAGATGSGAFTIGGTIVVKPDKAADITMAGIHIIEIGGTDYIDMGTGSFISSPTSSSMVDSFAPSAMFSSMIDPSTVSGFTKVGTEQKNGVTADHYQGSQAALSDLGSALGVQGATWTADVWIATNGGYPVGMAIIGTAADKSIAYEILFNITNVNDPSNTVTKPTNVAG